MSYVEKHDDRLVALHSIVSELCTIVCGTSSNSSSNSECSFEWNFVFFSGHESNVAAGEEEKDVSTI